MTDDPEINDRLRKRRTFADPSLESVPATPFSNTLRPNTAALLRTRLLHDCPRLREVQQPSAAMSAFAASAPSVHHNLNNLAVTSFVRDLVLNCETRPPMPVPVLRFKRTESQIENSAPVRQSEVPKGGAGSSSGAPKAKISFSIESIIGIK